MKKSSHKIGGGTRNRPLGAGDRPPWKYLHPNAPDPRPV